MIIDEEVPAVSVAPSGASPSRPHRRRGVLIGITTVVGVGAVVFGVVVGSTAPHTVVAASTAVQPPARDAVGERAAPLPNQVQTPRSGRNAVRSLVERGLVPAATLDDGTQIIGSALRPTRDDVVRSLVERGLVPAATLDDGTRITRSVLRP